MATTTTQEQAMNITHNGRTYTITGTGVESDICHFYEITGKRSTGMLLVYKPDTFGTCARIMGISELERLSDYATTVLIADQTDLITLEEVAA
jgi:hypothetical protein